MRGENELINVVSTHPRNITEFFSKLKREEKGFLDPDSLLRMAVTFRLSFFCALCLAWLGNEEECAKSMGQRSNYAAGKDAQTKLKKNEFVSGMWQSSIDVAAKDAQVKLRMEGCASDMEQSSNDAAMMDVQITPNVEECARDTGHIANHTMNQLLLDLNIRNVLQR